MIGRGDPRGADAEGLREFDKIRIDQVGRHDPTVKTLALVAPHIAVGIVIEHEYDNADVELYGRGEFLHAEHEAAVARDRNHWPVGMRDLDAERGRKTRSERALISRTDERPRLVDG